MYEKHIKVAPKSLSVDYVLRKDPSPHLKLGGLLYDLLPLVGHDSTDPQVGLFSAAISALRRRCVWEALRPALRVEDTSGV